jgi:hypothetical protein
VDRKLEDYSLVYHGELVKDGENYIVVKVGRILTSISWRTDIYDGWARTSEWCEYYSLVYHRELVKDGGKLVKGVIVKTTH